MKILLAEDDPQLGPIIADYLNLHDFEVTHVDCGKDAMNALAETSFDAIVLDLTLPDEDGLVILRKIRQWLETPVLICSARGTDNDRITGLEFGARDYLTKPFASKELVLRLRNLVNGVSQSHNKPAQDIEFGPFRLDQQKKQLINTQIDSSIPLTPKEYGLLLIMGRRPGHVFSRSDLIDGLPQLEGPETLRAIDILISRLRRKIETDARAPQYIKTVTGFGYKLSTHNCLSTAIDDA